MASKTSTSGVKVTRLVAMTSPAVGRFSARNSSASAAFAAAIITLRQGVSEKTAT